MNHHEYSAEQLNALRQKAERLLSAAGERRFGASSQQESLPPLSPEPTGLYFDWTIPELNATHLLTFIAEVHYRGTKANVRFQIDLTKLAPAEAEKLHSILAARHAGVDNRLSLLRSIEWMLTVSLAQTSPNLTAAERELEARRRLLVAGQAPEFDPLPIIGISPLLSYVSQNSRNQLAAGEHHLDIAALEDESFRLNLEFERFKQTSSERDFQLQSGAFTEKLLAHHRRVKQAGTVLGGLVGHALTDYADLAIEKLMNLQPPSSPNPLR